MTTLALLTGPLSARESVILLHGLCRTKHSMSAMEKRLNREDYHVINHGYPSRAHSIQELSDRTIGLALAEAGEAGATKIHFVTHSLGGILVRSYLSRHEIPELGRVVMLGPPNQGSEVVDRLGCWRLFKALNGPAGIQLGTDPDSIPNTLGPAHFPLGIIAGCRSINWINSCFIIGPDDGKVSVERTKVEGMAEHLVIPVTHPFLMKKRVVIEHTVRFLRTGSFQHALP